MEIVSKRKRAADDYIDVPEQDRPAHIVPDSVLEDLEVLQRRLLVLRNTKAEDYPRIVADLKTHGLTIPNIQKQLEGCVMRGNTVRQVHGVYSHLSHRFVSVLQGVKINTKRASFSTIPFQGHF